MLISESPGHLMDVDMVSLVRGIRLIPILIPLQCSLSPLRLSHMPLILSGDTLHPQQQALFALINENVHIFLFLIHAFTDCIVVDDRFDPYASSSKRRAVSPSISYFREAHPSLHPRTPGTPRLSIPVGIPVTNVNSAASSPTVSGSYTSSSIQIPRNSSMGHMSVSSSPTMRSSMSLASPIMRPLARAAWRGEGEEREVEGAGEAVGGLTLG